ncbi:hypothetical protein QM787_03910 [Rhodococcus ruber]|uniref:Uncharacterized protein n=1 Tax=Rhodococcus ruber TaxID=1830 RepID=A0A098BU70_9NOCA|nr:hypothetical protein [Rhodococcus ruber]MCD2127646.1 hypothetical protein [Rhodococcus ruber]MCZ4504302.1 hypothetical protein [Rhodococcus ruber]MCZ4529462.1 hypothetical protein [Rhodococcus ruber]MCZ4620963.1 hypothetical protein [Rhodococcus ruber]MDI9966987.1 hypothetical protein [Rhodococcus ruber]
MISDSRHRLDQIDAAEARVIGDVAANLAYSLTDRAAQPDASHRGELLVQANAAVNLAISWRTYAAMWEADNFVEPPTPPETRAVKANGAYEVSLPAHVASLAECLGGQPVDIAYRPRPTGGAS